ncbi:V-type ATP synthase subunit E [Fretibacterium sp. OH1220_COT-178]|uniref:V-type ATP synthase subunit E n=1 Tax=Fretibacterium sp. OH1220_COT-178 TaxID=2491047 RepID=UPI000F5F30CF|nr:V-type ATP synthase subunit E [Fretibacterium sp. OH1220_COT-178]RRD66266.1 hypothetical protein EII26_00560 [Fretibacterium sp. OH1220_COT-178]
MSLADIKARISAEAQDQIRAIEAENDARVAEITGKAEAEVKAIRDSYGERLSKEEPEVARRRKIVAELDAAKVDLGVRQTLVGEAFESSLRRLAEMPRDQYVAFANRLMEQAVRTGHEVVLVGRGEKHLDKSWLDEYNTAHQTSLVLSPDRLSISGGFVLRDGRIDVNCSWDMLLEDIRSEIESEVVRKLFP